MKKCQHQPPIEKYIVCLLPPLVIFSGIALIKTFDLLYFSFQDDGDYGKYGDEDSEGEEDDSDDEGGGDDDDDDDDDDDIDNISDGENNLDDDDDADEVTSEGTTKGQEKIASENVVC